MKVFQFDDNAGCKAGGTKLVCLQCVVSGGIHWCVIGGAYCWGIHTVCTCITSTVVLNGAVLFARVQVMHKWYSAFW